VIFPEEVEDVAWEFGLFADGVGAHNLCLQIIRRIQNHSAYLREGFVGACDSLDAQAFRNCNEKCIVRQKSAFALDAHCCNEIFFLNRLEGNACCEEAFDRLLIKQHLQLFPVVLQVVVQDLSL
jgi:hypothetical protein